MKVFVAGATGALGRQLVPAAGGARARGRGHDPRAESKQDLLRELGARPVVADALDPDAVARAVAEAEPEVIVHQLTAISGDARPAPLRPRLRADQPAAHRGHRPPARRRPRRRRRSASSPRAYAGWPYARTGGPVKTEDDPLDPDPPGADAQRRSTAIRHLEAGGDRRRLDRGDRAALRRLLRARHVARPRAERRAWSR